MTETEIKYAVYVVLVEDSNNAFEHLMAAVDTVETVKLDLDYEKALELLQEKAWG
jgi:hypothetical protein